jgi:hypothetical protein
MFLFLLSIHIFQFKHTHAWQTLWTLSIVWWWLKIHDVSETGICLRHQVTGEGTYSERLRLALSIGPIGVGTLPCYLMTETDSSLRNVVYFNHHQTMDNVHKVCRLNKQSSQTFRIHTHACYRLQNLSYRPVCILLFKTSLRMWAVFNGNLFLIFINFFVQWNAVIVTY